MNGCTVNSTTPEASTNSTINFTSAMGELDICVFSISFLLGLPSHSYVLWLIITGTGNGISSDFFNLNLSVCEISYSLNCFLILLSSMFQSLKALTQFCEGLVITGRPLFQCLICVERYLAVVHPVTFLKFKPLRYRVICSTAAWIFCFGSCLSCMFLLVSFSKVPFNCFYLIQFLLFLSIQLFCLLAVLRALKQSGPGERGREREEENHMKRRAFNIILITTVSTAVTYVPYSITGLFTLLTKHDIQVLWSISLTCFMLAGFSHPVLYLHRTGKFSCLCGA